MITGRSLGCSRALRAVALWLGLAALTIQGLAPFCLPGMMAGAAGVQSIVICTIHGSLTIRVATDGKPIPNAPIPDRQNSTCPVCAGFQAAKAFTTPVLLGFVVPADFTRALLAITSAPAPSLKSHSSYISRAPPGWVSTRLA